MVCFDSCFDRNEVPCVFSEPYIKGGYRAPYQPYQYYLKSLFFYHNEIINMWTALLTIIMHIYLFQFCAELDNLFMLNLAGTFIHVFSFVAHTFSHHSPKVHIACYLLDYLGIYVGSAQVMPSFLVLYLNISLSSFLIYALLVIAWHCVVFRNCCAMFYVCWQPWLSGGSPDLVKPRVLTFVIKSVWPFSVFWLLMNIQMCFDHFLAPASSGDIDNSLSSSLWIHVMSLSSLALECILLKARYPECVLPDYFQSFRSHPITHFCAATVTLGVAAAFIIDKNHLLQTSDEVTAKLESDWPITMLSILNMIFCATVAARTVLKMMSTETEN